ncbi:hypothetical protein REPUB_Repub18cG0011100 [Reevesia pubescens]
MLSLPCDSKLHYMRVIILRPPQFSEELAWLPACLQRIMDTSVDLRSPSHQQFKVNVEGTTKVNQTVLLGMVKRKKGAIVNIGSGAAIVTPSDPLYVVYAATKA